MRRHRELRPEELRRRVDPERLRFETTEEVAPLVGTVGQPRALDAIAYGLGVATAGFNIFVAGAPGSGRLTTVLDYVRSRAAAVPSPDDWVYVHNFAAPERPNAIRLPAGQGREFAQAMDDFLAGAAREIARAFESEEYDRRRRELLSEGKHAREELDEELTAFAAERDITLQVTPAGVASMPLVDGKPITREQFEALSEEQRGDIHRRSVEVEERTAAYAHQVRELEKQTTARVHELDQEVGAYATGPLFRELDERYGASPEVAEHLADVRREVLANLSDFRGDQEEQHPVMAALAPRGDGSSRFRVNVFVDNGGAAGAPVVVEHNPTYYNLVGRVEYRASFGVMVTDVREIKAGALQRANGGFLVLDVLEVLRHPFAWEALKRALRAKEARIENLGDEFSAVPSATLRPEPVPLDLKVVLLGPPLVHRVLYQTDEDFRELFKVKAEFASELDWNAQHQRDYAAFVSRWVRENDLRHFDRGAVARLIEHGGRLREDQRKLSARLLELSDVISEASFWAGEAGRPVVEAADVELAVRKREYRSNLIEERIEELIDRGTIVIDTAGERLGEVNGLAVIDLGDYSFGRPTRVSASISLGRGGIESIERETDMSGPIHSKGVLILAGYLAATYAQDLPLALHATLTFEQSYDEVEGDSASSTELYALLSALANAPIDQGIAVTGSVDQRGRVQAVGGVTRKVEGFYAVCKAKGLTGRQGVIVPAANAENLMLDEEIVEAAAQGLFHVWAVETVDEGIELLTGVPAGRPAADGAFPEGTIHARAAARLEEFADAYRDFAGAGDGSK